MKGTVGIYAITSPTRKVYIGQSYQIEKRFIQYRNLICKDQFRIYNSLKKHGVENHSFEIIWKIEFEITKEAITEYEQLFMNRYRQLGYELMNLKDAGPKGRVSDETKQRMSVASKGRPSKLKGIPKSPEHIEKMKAGRKKQVFSQYDRDRISTTLKEYYKTNSPAFKGKHHSEESKRTISEKNKGKKFPEELKERYSKERSGEKNLFYGKKHTLETRTKISKGQLGLQVGAKNGRARSIIQYDLYMNPIKEFSTVTEAASEIGISRLCISAVLIGQNKKTHGYKFKYA